MEAGWGELGVGGETRGGDFSHHLSKLSTDTWVPLSSRAILGA